MRLGRSKKKFSLKFVSGTAQAEPPAAIVQMEELKHREAVWVKWKVNKTQYARIILAHAADVVSVKSNIYLLSAAVHDGRCFLFFLLN